MRVSKEELVYSQVQSYLKEIAPERPPGLVEMEAIASRERFPIIGPAAGAFCYLVTRMIGARAVFELGSGFGYSTAWFARAVEENGGGVVHHVVWDEQLSTDARRRLAGLGHEKTVRFHVGEAVETLRRTEGPFDLVFNDIDKRGYPDSLPVIEEKIRRGGVLIIDNMLWHGRIFDEKERSPDTEGVRLFTRTIVESSRWISSLLPIRDGLIVALRT